MARRFRTSSRRGISKRRTEDLIWVPVPIFFNANEATGGQTLLQQSDWEATFSGTAFERCVLKRIVGQLCFTQSVVAAAANYLGLGIVKMGFANPTNPNPTIVADLGQFDWLWLGARALQTTLSSTFALQTYMDIDIKTQRKLTTDDVIVLSARIPADAGTPAAQVMGTLRCLVDRQ